MREQDFRPILERFFQVHGLATRAIPESSRRTPDYEVCGNLQKSLLELKIKSDDEEEIGEWKSVLASGNVASHSQPMTYRNTSSGIISKGVKQMLEHDPSRTVDHILWLHASGISATAYEEQFEFSLYGTQRLWCSQRPELVHCYFFHNSEFWRYRSSLAAAFISIVEEGQMSVRFHVNPYYERVESFRCSELRSAMPSARDLGVDPLDEHEFVVEGPVERTNASAVLEYLRSKYNVEDLQVFNMGLMSAAVLPKSEEEKDAT